MQDSLNIIYLALMQGFTEFLPISSSAHLVLLPKLSGWTDQGLAFDVAVHVGSLLAVGFYFRHELLRMSVDWWRSLGTHQVVGESRLAWAVIWGTIPVAVVGYLFHHTIQTEMRSPLLIAWATFGFAVLLWMADRCCSQVRNEHTLTRRDIAMIGLAQVLALVPGTSRSGVTMTAALMLGLSREAAARFSFLLSVPVIFLAGSYQVWLLLESGQAVQWGGLLLGVTVSAVTAWTCIHYFLKWISRMGMLPFVIYRFVLAGILFWLVYMKPGFFT